MKSTHTPPQKSPFFLRVIAIFKLISAALLFAVGCGLFHLLGTNLDDTAVHFIHRLHLDPENKTITKALAGISGVSQVDLKALDIGTFLYALLYIVEGIGLLKGKHWAEYLTIIATASLIPIEIYELTRKLNVTRSTILLINIAIAIYLIYQLIADRKAAKH